jgi:hypothetical protein
MRKGISVRYKTHLVGHFEKKAEVLLLDGRDLHLSPQQQTTASRME